MDTLIFEEGHRLLFATITDIHTVKASKKLKINRFYNE